MTEQILIGRHKFRAIKTVTLTEEATVCKRRVENQAEIADHVIENPVVFEFEVELFNENEEYSYLKDLYKKKLPFTLVTHRGVFDNIVLAKLSDTLSQSNNTTTASITVQQVLIGKTKTVKLNTAALPTTVTTKAEGEYSGGTILKNVEIKLIPQTLPAKTAQQTGVGYCNAITPNLASSIEFLNRKRTKT